MLPKTVEQKPLTSALCSWRSIDLSIVKVVKDSGCDTHIMDTVGEGVAGGKKHEKTKMKLSIRFFGYGACRMFSLSGALG